MHKIPLFDLNFDGQEEKAVLETIRSKWISMGPKTEEFEDLFAEMLGAKYAIALSNCTAALHLAMILCEISADDEVICPSLTFAATVNAIRYLNAKPVFADVVSYEDLTIDPKEIEIKITEKTKAIIVMHYGGFACDMDAIIKIARKKNLKVIEDACHAPLSEYKGKKLGTIGDVGCFSFFSNKNVSTGEGGMLVTNNDDFNDKVRLLRSHGMTTMSYQRATGHSTSYDVVELGYNYRMDDIRASIGIVQLNKLKNDLEKRAQVREWYIEQLGNCDGIIIPFKKYSDYSSNYIFPIIKRDSNAEERDLLRNKLADSGIQTSIHYPAVHKFFIYRNYYKRLNHTEYISDNIVTLPMYWSLTKLDINYICKFLIN